MNVREMEAVCKQVRRHHHDRRCPSGPSRWIPVHHGDLVALYYDLMKVGSQP